MSDLEAGRTWKSVCRGERLYERLHDVNTLQEDVFMQIFVVIMEQYRGVPHR